MESFINDPIFLEIKMEGRRSYLKRTGLVLLGLAASSTSAVASGVEEKKQSSSEDVSEPLIESGAADTMVS